MNSISTEKESAASSLKSQSDSCQPNDEVSRYDLLLKQVESLKLENSSLKKELNSNTSQITRLESVASSLKEMVLKLGSSIQPQSPTIDNHVSSNLPPSLSYNSSPLNLSLPLAQSNHYSSSSLLALNSQAGFVNHSPMAGSSSEIRWQLHNLNLKRSTILDSLRREEITKEKYLRHLNGLNDKLKNMTETDQSFSPFTENSRRSLESNVRETQEMMERDLGSPGMMRYRVQDWLHQIKLIDHNIQLLRNQCFMLESPLKPHFPLADGALTDRRLSEQDEGIFIKHGTFVRGSRSLCDISIQTPNMTCQLEKINIDKLDQILPVQSKSPDGALSLSRSCQTHQTCLGSGTASSLSKGLRFGSAVSLPDHLNAEVSSDLSKIHRPCPGDVSPSLFNFPPSLPPQMPSYDAKVKVTEIISKLDTDCPEDVSKTAHVDSSHAIRQAGHLPLVIKLLHDGSFISCDDLPKEKLEKKREMRKYASKALRNIVCSNPNKEQVKIDELILGHLETVRAHCDAVHRHACQLASERLPKGSPLVKSDALVEAMKEIRQLVYNEQTRPIVNELGGLFCVAELLVLDCKHSNDGEERSIVLRQCSGHALTALVFGSSVSKAALIKIPCLLDVVIQQLQSNTEELQQVMASILRNLSCQVDEQRRECLKQKGVATVLTKCVISAKKESTLKSMLGALWNVSGHCPENRVEICKVEGCLSFLVSTLTYRSPSRSTDVVENGGGILRNVSSVIATNKEYRMILRKHDCLQILLKQLASPSLTIVSNACGTLWNLSARNLTDQQSLFDLGALAKLGKLVHSKHSGIAQGSAAALRNLLANQPEKLTSILPTKSDGSSDIPTLQARKVKHLQSDIKEAALRNASDLPETFSPRHQAQVQEKSQTPSQSATQRHSLQVQPEECPQTKRKSQATSFYSGSLGNLSQHPCSPLGRGRPFQAWEQSNSPKNKHFAPSTSVMLARRSGLAESFKKPDSAGLNSNSSATDPDPVAHSGPVWDARPVKTWGNQRNDNSLMNRGGDSTWPMHGNSASQRNQAKLNKSVSRMPTDLQEKLRNVYKDYCMQEDDDVPVDYSLQYTDELSAIHAVQGPLDGDQNHSGHSRSGQVPNTNFTKSFPNKEASPTDAKDKNVGKVQFRPVNSSTPPNQQTGQGRASAVTRPKIDPSVEQKVLYADEEMFGTEDTPTNFGAIYAEEHLYEPYPETTSIQHYSGLKSACSQHFGMQITNGGDTVHEIKKYNVEDTPICFSDHSSLSDISGDVDSTDAIPHPKSIADNDSQVMKRKQQPQDYETSEESSKIYLQSGTTTPGHYIRSGRQSGLMTPRTPMCQETPLMCSPGSSSRSPIDTGDEESFHSDVTSEPGSHMPSGYISPSELPDSPGQSMPQSRCRSPSNLNSAKNQHNSKPYVAGKEVEVTDDHLKISSGKSSISNIAGQQLIEKAHAMSAGYLATLPQPDEMKAYTSEPAMSVMSSFSGLTIDGSKVKPVQDLRPIENSETVAKEDEENPPKAKDEENSGLREAGSRAIMQAGYITSLPTSDEIKHFVCEGSLSPLTGLSEISAIRSHNDGFQKGSGSLISKLRQPGESNRNSFTSRSSATGASVPLPPISQKNEPTNSQNASASVVEATVNDVQSPVSSSSQSFTENAEICEKSDSDLSDLLNTSSDDNEMLEKCINLGLPKKKSSRSKSGRSSSSSSRKEKSMKHSSPKTTPKPAKKSNHQSETSDNKTSQRPQKSVCKFDTRDRIAAANNRLNGMDIIQYIHTKMASVPGDSSDSSENVKQQTVAIATEEKDEKDPTDALQRTQTCRQVIKSVETLDESYSVKKQIRKSDKITSKDIEEAVPAQAQDNGVHADRLPVMPDNAKVQAFLQSRPTTFATEGTPIEMSRSTSWSNLTIESGTDAYDFSALQKKMAENQNVNLSVNVNSENPANLARELQECNAQESVLNKNNNNKEVSDESKNILKDLGEQISSMTLNAVSGSESLLPSTDQPANNTQSSSFNNALNVANEVILTENELQTKVAPQNLNHANTYPHSNVREEPAFNRETEPPEKDNTFTHDQMGNTDPSDLLQCQHYGEERHNIKDKLMTYGIEDTPYCISGNNSSLSSIDIDTEGEGFDLLKNCISSAMPVARADLHVPPPNQLVLMQQTNQPQSSVHGNSSNTNSFLNSMQSPDDSEWAAVHRGANAAAAAMLTKDKTLNGISPLSLASLSSPDPNSATFSLSTGQDTQPSDGFYRLSRQPSLGESIGSDVSNGSLMLGGTAKSLMKSQNENRPKISKRKESSDRIVSDDPHPTVKGRKKIYRSPITGKPREDLRYPMPTRNSDSSRSSSTKRNEQHNRNSEGNKSACSKCHSSHSHQIPMSMSMGRLEDTVPGRSRRKNTSSNYNSKYIVPCGHFHESRKPVRSRSAHAGYQSSVTQLYPRLPGIQSIVMDGVMSMAKRGDTVLAHYDGQTSQVVPVASYAPHGCPANQRPILLKQGTFIQEYPSQALLQSGAHNIPSLYKVVSKPQASKPTKKSQPKQKNKVTLKKRLKNFLSPSEENKQIPGSLQISSSKKKQPLPGKPATKYEKQKGNNPGVSDTKREANTKENKLTSQANVTKKNIEPTLPTGGELSSSLSLSSSSASNESNEALENFRPPHSGKSNYLTASSIKSSNHIPKSPAANLRRRIETPSSSKNVALSNHAVSSSSSNVRSSQSALASRKNSSSSTSSFANSSRNARGAPKVSSIKKKPGSQASLSSSNHMGKHQSAASSVSLIQHVPSQVFIYEEPGSSLRQSLDDAHLFTPVVRRVVQEVAPFNYRPSSSQASSEKKHGQSKLEPSTKQTTV